MEFFLYKVETTKGSFMCSVQAEDQAAVFWDMVKFFADLKLPLIEAIRRKQETGDPGERVTLFREATGLGCCAGKKLWAAVGRVTEYEATMVANGLGDVFVQREAKQPARGKSR